MDGDTLAAYLAELISGEVDSEEWRALLRYDRASTRLSVDAMRHAPIISGMGAGDPYQVGLRWTSGDVGGTSATVAGVLMRNRCVNIQIVKDEVFARLGVTHRKGNEQKARENMAATMRMVNDLQAQFAPLYTKAYTTPIVQKFPAFDATSEDSVREVMRAITGMRAMSKVTTAIARDTATEALLLGFQKEPGSTLLSIERAVTRVHDGIIPAKHVPLFEEAAIPLMRELTR
jgi:hypothetical protein